VIGGGSGDVISHNTFSNGASIRIGHVNVGASSNETVTDNVLTGGFWFSEGQWSGGFTVDYNMIPGGGGGTHGINASPQFQGGPGASTYAGFDLVFGSIGTNAASNGADIGIPPGPTGGGDTTPPATTITATPPAGTTSTSASVSFTGSDNVGVTAYECSLDGAGYAPCSSPKAYSGLGAGPHTFSVRAKDAAGNVDASPASYTWTVTPAADTTAPDTSITGVITPGNVDASPASYTWTIRRRKTQAAAADATATVAISVRVRRAAHGHTVVSGAVPAKMVAGRHARVLVQVKRHGRWKTSVSRLVRVGAHRTFRLTAKLPAGQVRVRAARPAH
jgi:hypothetical protein